MLHTEGGDEGVSKDKVSLASVVFIQISMIPGA
jgi:hypothetical protein